MNVTVIWIVLNETRILQTTKETSVEMNYQRQEVFYERIFSVLKEESRSYGITRLSNKSVDINTSSLIYDHDNHDYMLVSSSKMIFWKKSFEGLCKTIIEVLVKDHEWLPGTPEALSGTYVFVCSHGSRDRRCGVCGPALITRFKEEIDVRGVQGVSVSACSHMGGHKYAGNMIIFSNNDGVVSGQWYGYVTPDDVPLLLEQHIGKGEIIDRLWRGQMGLSVDKQKHVQELRLHLNNEANYEKIIKEPVDDYEIEPNDTSYETAGCCQGNESSSCCQVPERIELNNHVVNEEVKMSKEKKKKKSVDKKLLRTNSVKGTSTRKVCAMPTWFESWEREDTYAALAVVGAFVSVAIAYSSYKKLR
ncbi:hypothetical protein MKW94_014790 [Papaver nudicaule]|uniref:Altered inheritance of mitochondria protein 32 n=1 Tax=Papaver nudicaule TaxID=74823 RepID=A0AA41S595_PAPNU|nr:hypothetical protein [Papaver nudicaule]